MADDYYNQMLNILGINPDKEEGPSNLLRCNKCDFARERKTMNIGGKSFVEAEGGFCERSVSHGCNGILGKPDAADQEIAQFMENEAMREVAEQLADKLARFHSRLTDQGVDSYGAAMLSMAFATGQISPANMWGWK